MAWAPALSGAKSGLRHKVLGAHKVSPPGAPSLHLQPHVGLLEHRRKLRGSPSRLHAVMAPWMEATSGIAMAGQMGLEDPAVASVSDGHLLQTCGVTVLAYMGIMTVYSWLVDRAEQEPVDQDQGSKTGGNHAARTDLTWNYGKRVNAAVLAQLAATHGAEGTAHANSLLAARSADYITGQISECRDLTRLKLLQKRITSTVHEVNPAAAAAVLCEPRTSMFEYIDACLDCLGPRMLLHACEEDIVNNVAHRVAEKAAWDEIQLIVDTYLMLQQQRAHKLEVAPGQQQRTLR